MSNWYRLSIPQLLRELNTDLEVGLSSNEAQERLSASQTIDDQNFLIDANSSISWHESLTQFFQLSIFAQIVAIIVLMRDFEREAIAIGVLLSIQILSRLWRNFQSDRWRNEMRELAEMSVRIIRDGREIFVPLESVVVGDLLRLREGDYIPADARLIETNDVSVDESKIFGPHTISAKQATNLGNDQLQLEDQKNMIFGGTFLIRGEAIAIVVATGKDLAINNLPKRPITEIEHEPESETESDHFAKLIRWSGVTISAAILLITFVASIISTSITPYWHEVILLSLTFIVATDAVAIPQIARHLASKGISHLSTDGFIVKNRSALETISRVDTICTAELDETEDQKLTLNAMFVDSQLITRKNWTNWLQQARHIPDPFLDGNSTETTFDLLANPQVPRSFPLLISSAKICADYLQEETNRPQGKANSFAFLDSTLADLAIELGYDREFYQTNFNRFRFVPDYSGVPYHSLIAAQADMTYVQFAFGEIEEILRASANAEISGTTVDLKADDKRYIREVAKSLIANGSTVIAFAERSFDAPPQHHQLSRNLTFIGFVAFNAEEPIDLRNSIENCLNGGFKIVAMTELDPQHSVQKATQCGLVSAPGSVVSSEKLEEISEENYEALSELILVYSKPNAEQKINAIRHLKRQDHNILFWGKRTDDLRSIKIANCSVSSLDYAQPIVQYQTDVLVRQSGFSQIFSLLQHARRFCENLIGSLRWLFSVYVAQLMTLLIGLSVHVATDLEMPIDLKQLIWSQFLLLVIAPIGLATIEGTQPQNLRPNTSRDLFANGDIWDVLIRGVVIGLMSNVGFVIAFSEEGNLELARTMAITVLVFASLASSFQCQRLPWETLMIGLTSNRKWLSVLAVLIGLQLIMIYLPIMQSIFATFPIGREWIAIAIFSVVMLLPLNLRYQH